MLKLTIAILAAILLTACGGPAKRTEKQQEKTILCGGYTQQRPLEASERELFRQLISVSGVGGNTARMILSTYSPRELQSIITTENAVLLKNVKGLGLKTAQKIIVELSGKLTALFDGDAGPLPVAGNGDAVYDEATAALVMLGFPKAASDKVVRAILKEQPDISVEETVRMSLKRL